MAADVPVGRPRQQGADQVPDQANVPDDSPADDTAERDDVQGVCPAKRPLRSRAELFPTHVLLRWSRSYHSLPAIGTCLHNVGIRRAVRVPHLRDLTVYASSGGGDDDAAAMLEELEQSQTEVQRLIK